jgi:hypothetical protein
MTARRVGAIIAVVAALFGIGAFSPISASAVASAVTEQSVEITVSPQDLGALQPGQPLRLAVTITNPTANELPPSIVTASIDRMPAATRAELSAWLADSTKGITADVRVGQLSAPAITPGQSRTFSMTIAPSALGFGAAGVYAVGVRLSTGTATLASDRTAVVWKLSDANPVKLAIAQPLTVPASSTALIDAGSLAEYTSPTGPLTRELDAAIDTNVAIGIDPRVIASIRILGNSAPPTAVAWLGRLALASNDTFPLTWADSDLTAEFQSGASSALAPRSLDFAIDPTRFAPVAPTPTDGAPGSTAPPTSDPSLPPLPTSESLVAWNYTMPKVAWPSDNSVTKRDLTVLSRSGFTTTILSSNNVTRSAKAAQNVSATVNGVASAISDIDLSTYLRQAVAASDFDDWNSAMARLTASLALASDLSSGSPVSMLVTLDRNWPTTGYRLQPTIDALYSRPWAAPATLPSVTAQSASTGKLVERKQDGFRIRRSTDLLEEETLDARFATIAADPSAISSPLRLQLLALLSNAWKSDEAGWQSATAGFFSSSIDLRASVQVVDSSTINFLNDRGSLPVTVSNKLEQPVTVYIRVRPLTPLIAVEDSRVKVTIEPDSQRKGQVSVQSLSNGSVLVNVSLAGESGFQVGKTAQVKVNVQAGWETAGTVVFAGLVVAIFAFGIVRNIRKRRKAARE